MTFIAERTCREIKEKISDDYHALNNGPIKLISKWENAAAYVLLGPPGSGKTTVFRYEAERQDAKFVTARDFLTLDPVPDEWRDTILFIDGLDEQRAGAADGRTTLDSIRAKLHQIRFPRFRLSCREADWFGTSDRNHLKSVTPDKQIIVLRLEPLSDQDVRSILLKRMRIDDPDEFIATAEKLNIREPLTNPLNLKMFANAVKSRGTWPKTRKQAFEMACRVLSTEFNQEHHIAQTTTNNSYSISNIENTSGKLCALMLLTGSAGYSRFNEDNFNSQFLSPDQIPEQDQTLLRRCLQSRVFKSPSGAHAVPAHRQIGEFLAAQYLASLVDNGLPVGRILALITGSDGRVVSELRGLAAWLATHSNNVGRAEIIARDPLGTILYGDISEFTPREKEDLLRSLQRETKANPYIIQTLQLDSRLGDLVSSDMEQFYCKTLNNQSRSDSWQSFLVIVITALRYGTQLPDTASRLMAILRDNTWWPKIQLEAIEPFLRHCGNEKEGLAELKVLAEELRTGKVQDPEDRLFGCVLSTLFPETISEKEIVQYLHPSKNVDSILEYEHFLNWGIVTKSRDNQLDVLLDECVKYRNQLFFDEHSHRTDVFNQCQLPLNLLAKALPLLSDEIDLPRLSHWLEVAALSTRHRSDSVSAKTIREWLEKRPKVWISLLEMCIKECASLMKHNSLSTFENCINKEIRGRLFCASYPSYFGLWCLDHAVLMEEKDANVVHWLLNRTAQCLLSSRFDLGLSRKSVSKRLKEHANLQAEFDKAMALFQPLYASVDKVKHNGNVQMDSEHPNWHTHVKPHENELRENVASPALLHELATVYFGGYMNVSGNSPQDRLKNLLAGDNNLVDAILSGFRQTAERSDLPSYRKIIRLGTSDQMDPLARPFMAGFEKESESASTHGTEIDDELSRLALSIHYTVPMWPSQQQAGNQRPHWYRWLVSNRSDLVAEVMMQSILIKLRNGKEFSNEIYELRRSDHADVARIVALPLLEKFPARCKPDQLSCLDDLLRAVMLHCENSHLTVANLVEKKLANPNMYKAQRIYWLTVGLSIAPEDYVDRLESFANNEHRVSFLVKAVTGNFFNSTDLQLKYRESATALQLLIRLIGAYHKPYSQDFDKSSLAILKIADQVQVFIDQLVAIPTEAASLALEELLSELGLQSWRRTVMDAVYQQKIIRSEAEFAYSDVGQVFDTLNNKSPANAADLVVLTLEKLGEIARKIRDGNTSDWRQYWNTEDVHPKSPCHENVCRDALLSDLQIKLNDYGVEAQPEGVYADDKRADIRVSYGDYNVPIEIKKSCHIDLWSAIQSQLIERYVRDPNTGGNGIYLVLWFGDAEDCKLMPPEIGKSPSSSQELQHRLKSTLTPGQRHKIKICVIDVAVPSSKAAPAKSDN